jgi:hypothetical protein
VLLRNGREKKARPNSLLAFPEANLRDHLIGRIRGRVLSTSDIWRQELELTNVRIWH